MSRPSDALEERRDAVRRSDLADEVDVTDVDAELQRCRRHERFQPAALQPDFGVEAILFREAAVMRSDRVLAEAVAEMAGQALGHAARVHEDERGAMFLDQRGEAVVVLLPHFVRHDRLERGARRLERQIHLTPVTLVHDGAPRIRGEVLRDFLDRLLRRGEPEPQERRFGDLL